jgi:hypothetical protein
VAADGNTPITAAVDGGNTLQTMEGFGTSLCWWAVGVGGWTNVTAFEELMDLFFAPGKGLGSVTDLVS